MTVLNEEFKVRKLNDVGIRKCDIIAHLFDDLLFALHNVTNVSNRESMIGRTKLEEACFFFKKSMCLDRRNQEPKKKDVDS